MVPIAFVQTLANIEGIQKVFPFLKPLIETGSVKSVIQGYLPGIIIKIFLILHPTIIMTMSKIEGYTAYSALQTRSAGKYHLFLLVNVFLGSIITGTALQQLKEFSNQSPTDYDVKPPRIPKTVGVSIPMKATFFITYVMVDGWSGIAAEITEKDREEAMDPGCLNWAVSEPRIQLYFLLGLVYSARDPNIGSFDYFSLEKFIFGEDRKGQRRSDGSGLLELGSIRTSDTVILFTWIGVLGKTNVSVYFIM
ncbi:CSC1-like protein isoform X1 [Tanacetum coccineum]